MELLGIKDPSGEVFLHEDGYCEIPDTYISDFGWAMQSEPQVTPLVADVNGNLCYYKNGLERRSWVQGKLVACVTRQNPMRVEPHASIRAVALHGLAGGNIDIVYADPDDPGKWLFDPNDKDEFILWGGLEDGIYSDYSGWAPIMGASK